MFNISLSDTLSRQLKEQGYKFTADADVSWFEEMLVSIDRLYVNCYVTETEYKKIRERFLEDLKERVENAKMSEAEFKKFKKDIKKR